MRAVVKICGATTVADVRMLGDSGADLVGLWHGVPGGRADLSLHEVSALTEATRTTKRLRPVLVTFMSDAEALLDAVVRTGVRWLQLHAYQPPAVVRALKQERSVFLTVVKVLHVRAGGCAEEPLIKSYERAGTDVFLLDTTTEEGQIGSTGQPLPSAAVIGVANQISRPFLLAGGISADNRRRYHDVVEHPWFSGVDVDTAARDPLGRFTAERVTAISQSWHDERQPVLDPAALP